MTKWISLHNHSHYSLLDGLSKPKDMVKKAVNCGYTSLALTDHASISGCIDFLKACKGKIKPILGSELYISDNDSTIHDESNAFNAMSHLVVLAKNLNGWKNLIKITSEANDPKNFYYRPRLDIEKLKPYAQDLIAFSGHPGSALAKEFQRGGDVKALAEKYQQIFGVGNFKIEVQNIYQDSYPEAANVAKAMRELAVSTGIDPIATADAHYVDRKDAIDQRVILCSLLKTTMSKVKAALANSEEFGLSGFFTSDKFHIPSLEEISELSTPEELANACAVADMCEEYNILSKPVLPKFVCPDNLSAIEYLKVLAREGWKQKIAGRGLDENVYRDRVLHELKVMEDSDLAGYMLIVQEYTVWAKRQGWLVGPGRGSVGGSLIAYLIDITTVDPIKYNLLFERFYNAGRNSPGNVSLPDIDVDFPITKRKYVIQHIQELYGQDKVTQIATFGSLQGRGALKEVLRIHEACNYDLMNKMTKSLPQRHEIADQLEESQETSIIRWTLENDPERISDYCTITDDGKFEGEFATYFEQASRLEGTYKSQGKHAAGVVISTLPVAEVCPMLRDKNSDERVAGFEMGALEAIGLVKMDILGIAVLDKLEAVNELLRYGKLNTSLDDLEKSALENEEEIE